MVLTLALTPLPWVLRFRHNVESGSRVIRLAIFTGFQGPTRKQDRAASSGRRMTFIRDGVGGGMHLTPNTKMDRQHVECERLRGSTWATRGLVSFGASA